MEKLINKNLMEVIKILIVLLILFLIKEIIHRLLNKVVKKKNDKNKITTISFLKKFVSATIYFIMIVFVLSQFAFFKSLIIPLLSGAGILAVVLGLAAQDTLSNFFSSLIIVFGNPFKIGDHIRDVENDIEGEVEEITFRHTIIRTINNRRLIIPNNKMNTLIIENYNYTDTLLCELIDYDISYDSDIHKATKILEEELNKLYNPNTISKKEIEFPKVRVLKLDESSIKLRAWVWGENYSNVYKNIYALNENIKKRFDKNNIQIPYNHLNVIVENDRKGKK